MESSVPKYKTNKPSSNYNNNFRRPKTQRRARGASSQAMKCFPRDVLREVTSITPTTFRFTRAAVGDLPRREPTVSGVEKLIARNYVKEDFYVPPPRMQNLAQVRRGRARAI